MDDKNIVKYRKLIENKRVEFETLYNNFSNNNTNDKKQILVAAFDLIITTSKKMSFYSPNSNDVDDILFDEIKSLSYDDLINIANESYTIGAISIIRYVIAKKFINNEINSAIDLKECIEQIKESFINKKLENFIPYFDNNHKEALSFIESYSKGNPFQSWGPLYRYLLPFVYDLKLRDAIWHAIEIIKNELLKKLNIERSWESKNSQGWYNKVRSYFGFEGPSNYGSQRAVIMLHPKNIPDHKNAVQLVCYFNKDRIWAGCDVGVNLKNKDYNIGINNWEKITDIDFNNCYGFERNEDLIEKKFDEIIRILKDNLAFAKKINESLLKENPNIGTQEIAEGDAEKSSDETDANLYDPFENKNDDKSQKPLPIGSAHNIKTKEIYPNIKPEEDFLERKKIGKYLAEKIIMNKKVEALNIGIYANWGSGKTQVFNFIKQNLKTKKSLKDYFNFRSNKEMQYFCEVVDFDAWQYNDLEHIWASLMMELMKKCMSKNFFYFIYLWHKLLMFIKTKWSEVLLKSIIILLLFLCIQQISHALNNNVIINILNLSWWAKFAGIILLAIFPDLFAFGFLNIDKEFLKCFKTPDYSEQLGFRKEIKDLICYTLSYLSNKGKKRIVLFIDNLDRCSFSNIKQIIDSISQFLEICNKNETNLITIFAMDKSIIQNALKEENIPADKFDEYLDKIINLPVYLKMPKDINSLINRFFGEEQNDTKEYLKKQYSRIHYCPRTLSNIRYLDHMIYTVYDKLLKDSEYYADLFKLKTGNDKSWEFLTNSEIEYSIEKDTEEVNRYANDSRTTIFEYKNIEEKTFNYLEQEYNWSINRHIKYYDKNNNNYLFFDGVATFPMKEILIEIKYVKNKAFLESMYLNVLKKLLKYSSVINTDKNLELTMIFVLDNIANKELSQVGFNKKLQKDLSNTKYSGQVLIISKDDLKH